MQRPSTFVSSALTIYVPLLEQVFPRLPALFLF